ncbi:hypothetical protein BDB01DRAFT_802776 [Pilobolus umbonatus]|nr:hypothetical protein BDB01DRAFT_802776 [Pilobolus umbonatus]
MGHFYFPFFLFLSSIKSKMSFPFNLSQRTKERGDIDRKKSNKRPASNHFNKSRREEDDVFQADKMRRPVKHVYQSRLSKDRPGPIVWDSQPEEADDFKPDILSTRLKKPKRKQTQSTEEVGENKRLFKSLETSRKEEFMNESKTFCPYCGENLRGMTDILERALKQIQCKIKVAHTGENDGSSFSKPLDLIRKSHLSHEEQEAFCKLHEIELDIKPVGRQRGYPQHIQFDKLESRIRTFIPELSDIINNTIKSDYREEALKAYDDLGSIKARSVGAVMNRFERSMPGYYGPRGLSIILDILSRLFIESGVLTKEKSAPQLPLEYVQQVLIPEVGYRLIRQDLQSNYAKRSVSGLLSHTSSMRVLPEATQKAKIVMEESRDYGNAIYPVLDDMAEQ